MPSQITFCDLRQKKVINVVDGKDLGSVVDLVFEECNGIILGLIVPNVQNGFFHFFRVSQTFIPWQNICKIGEDVILVELFDSNNCIEGCSVQGLDNKRTEKTTKANYQYNKANYEKAPAQPNSFERENFKIYDSKP